MRRCDCKGAKWMHDFTARVPSGCMTSLSGWPARWGTGASQQDGGPGPASKMGDRGQPARWGTGAGQQDGGQPAGWPNNQLACRVAKQSVSLQGGRTIS